MRLTLGFAFALCAFAQDTAASLLERARQQKLENDSFGERRTLVKVLQLDPKHFDALLQLGKNVLDAGDPVSAEPFLLRALNENGESAETLFQLGRMNEMRRESAEAERRYLAAIAAGPKHVEAHVALGKLYGALQRNEEAAKILDRALALAPADASALSAAGIAADRLGDPRRALALFRRAVEAKPEDAAIRATSGYGCLGVYDLECGLKALNEASQMAPEDATYHFHRARILYLLGRPAEAEPAAAEALKRNPRYAFALFLGALIARELNKPAGQRELLERYMDISATEAAGFLLLAEAYEAEGNLLKAADNWGLAASAKTEYGFTYGNLAKYHAASNPSMAKYYADRYALYRKAAQAPEESDMTFYMGKVAALMGDWPTAVRRLRAAAKACGKCRSAAYIPKELGMALANTGKRTEALAVLRTAPPDAEVRKAISVLE
ncbi:MAG: tetratricopeptide repeat protein [Acidobacteria bacterium]|nr:tetratricopeptide repeat protein [Acidobacteriota bacterium]